MFVANLVQIACFLYTQLTKISVYIFAYIILLYKHTLRFSDLVWPSKLSKFTSFKELIKQSYFKPSLNTNVTVKVKQMANDDFPVPACDVCLGIWTSRVHQEGSASTFEVENLVSRPITHAYDLIS